jgi:hypothetical protein
MHLVLLPPVFEEVKPQSISLLDISIGIFLDCSAETDNGASIASISISILEGFERMPLQLKSVGFGFFTDFSPE